MKPSRTVNLIGGAHSGFIGKFHPDFIWKEHPDYGKRTNPTLEEHLSRAVIGALADTGVSDHQIQRGYVGNFAGELFSKQGHLGSLLAGVRPGLKNKAFSRIEGACASGGLALISGIDAISAGCDFVLVAGVEVQTTVSARKGADYLARAAHYKTQRSCDPFTFPCLFARRSKAYRTKYGLGEEDLAQVVVKAYSNGNRNPHAHMQSVHLTLQEASTTSDQNPNFLVHPEYREYLKVTDCSQVSDGASAVILVSNQGLEILGKSLDRDVVQIVSYGHSTAPLDEIPEPLTLSTAEQAANEAYQDGRISPKEIGVAEVHDCFSITELLLYEALGFSQRGEAMELVRNGTTQLGGGLPVNTGGGLMAFGHPVGATGVKQALEIFKQQKGRAGDYQIPHLPEYGLATNLGGDDRTAVVTIYRNRP